MPALTRNDERCSRLHENGAFCHRHDCSDETAEHAAVVDSGIDAESDDENEVETESGPEGIPPVGEEPETMVRETNAETETTSLPSRMWYLRRLDMDRSTS